ncbi:MAG: hypothetical protein KA296_13775 [Marinobacter sp.]|nr:hypothetical protein [Marinobacter sp.]
MKTKTRKALKWLSGTVLAAVLMAVGATPPVATSLGPVINENIWGLFDDGDEERSAEGQQATEKRLLLDEGRDDRQGQAEEADAAVQLREEAGEQRRKDQLKEAAAAVLIDQVTRSLDKSQ